MKNIIITFMCLQFILLPIPKARAGDGIAEQLIGITNAVAGANVIIACKTAALLPSLMVFLGGGIAYVAGEMIGGKEHNNIVTEMKKDMDTLEQSMKNKVGGEAQRGALEAALKNEESIKSFASKRKTWMMAIAAIYGVATGLAIAESGILSAAIPIPGAPAALIPPFMAGICEGLSSIATRKLMVAGIVALYAMASGTDKLVALGVAIALYQDSFGTALLYGFNAPYVRIGVFGVAATSAAVVMGQMAEKAKKAGENADKLRAALAQLDADSKGPQIALTAGAQGGGSNGGLEGGSNAGAGGGVTGGSPRNFAVTPLKPGPVQVSRTCVAKNSSGGLDVSEKACGNPIRIPAVKVNGDMKLPSSISQGLVASQQFSQAVANGDSAKADVAAEKLASLSAKISEDNNKALAQLNDKLIKNGDKPINLEAEMAKSLAGAQSILNKQNANGSSLANISSGDSSKLSASAKDQSNQEIKGEENSNSIGLVNSGVNSGVTAGADSGIISEGAAIAGGADSLVATNEDSLNAKSKSENEISARDGDIWGIVSNRYILSFPRLMDKKKIPEK